MSLVPVQYRFMHLTLVPISVFICFSLNSDYKNVFKICFSVKLVIISVQFTNHRLVFTKSKGKEINFFFFFCVCVLVVPNFINVLSILNLGSKSRTIVILPHKVMMKLMAIVFQLINIVRGDSYKKIKLVVMMLKN